LEKLYNYAYRISQHVNAIAARHELYLKICDIIYNNYDAMIKCLNKVHGKSFDGNEVAQCAGLLFAIKKKTFRFSLCLMLKCLR
jgi:hypothetical protein